MTPTLRIRVERSADRQAVRALNEAAFGQPAEADIVDRLRERCAGLLSLVAEDESIVGHILFSPVEIDADGGCPGGMGLAPMAVLPARQSEGIGSALVRAGLGMLRERGCPYVVVLGHPEYYPRFGFERASAHGLRCSWDGVPDEAFMVQVFDRRSLPVRGGVVRYREEFDEAG